MIISSGTLATTRKSIESMTEQLKLTGMVISAMPVGEYDKRLVLLTTDSGERSPPFPEGSRRPKSPMLAATEPFVFGDFFSDPGAGCLHPCGG